MRRWLPFLLAASCAPIRVPFEAPELYRVGRFEPDGSFSASATRLSIRFEGSGKVRAAFRQTTRPESAEGPGQPLRMRFDVDGAVKDVFADDQGWVAFETVVPPGKHRFTMLRQSEAMIGEAKLVELELPPGARLESWKPRPLFEFIGDSVTVGFGAEGKDPCPFSSKTQAITAAWPWIVGEVLGADIRVVGWSGRGVVRNWGDREGPTVPQLWSAADPKPELVFIALGANDWWNSDPGPHFLRGYLDFVERVQKAYPGVPIWSVTTGPRAQVLKTAHELQLIEVGKVTGGGCVGHPDAQAQRRLADDVIAKLCGGEAGGSCRGAWGR